MRPRSAVTPGVTRAAIASVLIAFCAGAAWAGTQVSARLDGLDSRSAYTSGIELERSRNWLEAVELYEAAVKKWPDSKELQYGLRRSKIHFSIERRYADASFDRKLLLKSRSDALAVFDEVLGQVRTGYVDSISATSFVAHGTESLYLALANDRFLARNAPGADRARVAEVRGVLRDRYWNKPLANDDAARAVVIEVSDLAASTAGVPASAVVMEYIFGGCNALDDYSSFLTPDRLDDLYGNIEGEFVGLGIELKGEPGKGMLLVNVLPESPAREGGLQNGDHIVMIDGTDCRNLSTDEAAKLLRGLSGSRVKLRVERPNDTRTWEGSFVRRAVHVKSIPVAKIVDPSNGIGYIQMTGFQKTSAQELDEALAKLQRQGMRAVIWDVRGNPGGLLTAAVEVLDRFISEGVLVSTRGRSQDQNWSYSAHRNGTYSVPLVLLVDGDSASASEIVAGAVKDHRRGTIVGRQTFGKWSVQSIFPLKDETGLRLTTAKFYSPHGHTLSKIGVKPDIVIDPPAGNEHQVAYRAEDADPDQDPDLRAGIDILKKQLAGR